MVSLIKLACAARGRESITRIQQTASFYKNSRNDCAVSSQCPEINSRLEPEDEQNERVRRSGTDLNKRNGLNAGPPDAYLGAWGTWNFPFKDTSCSGDDTRVKERALCSPNLRIYNA